MNLETIKEKPLFQMTGEEFLFLQNNTNKPNTVPNEVIHQPATNKYVYGIKE